MIILTPDKQARINPLRTSRQGFGQVGCRERNIMRMALVATGVAAVAIYWAYKRLTGITESSTETTVANPASSPTFLSCTAHASETPQISSLPSDRAPCTDANSAPPTSSLTSARVSTTPQPARLNPLQRHLDAVKAAHLPRNRSWIKKVPDAD